LARRILRDPAALRILRCAAAGETRLIPHCLNADLLRDRDDPGKLLQRPVAVQEVNLVGWATEVARHHLPIAQLMHRVVVRFRPTFDQNRCIRPWRASRARLWMASPRPKRCQRTPGSSGPRSTASPPIHDYFAAAVSHTPARRGKAVGSLLASALSESWQVAVLPAAAAIALLALRRTVVQTLVRTGAVSFAAALAGPPLP